jgi:hypothetical protein
MTLVSDTSASWVKILPIVISSLAFVVSFFTLYRNYLARFKSLITVGAPVYQFGNAFPNAPGVSSTFNEQFDPKRDRVLAAILLPIVITHQSGRLGGYLRPYVARISNRGKRQLVFRTPIKF